MGDDEQTTTQQTTQSPWGPAIPELQKILSNLGGINPNLTATESGAIGQMSENAGALPNYTPQVQSLIADLFSGGTDRTGMVTEGYDTLRGTLSPIAAGSNVGPDGNPMLKNYLSTIYDDVNDNVSGMFAAAGRDLSPAHLEAISRGYGKATAPILAGQYNTDISNMTDAAKTLFSAGSSGATTLAGLDQSGLANRGAAIGATAALPSVANLSPAATLAAESLKTGLPLGRLAAETGIAAPIAGLGGDLFGTKTSPGPSMMQQITGGLIGGAGLLGGTGAFGSAGWLAPLLLSDERFKEDIAKIGKSDDGQNIYSFRYVGQPETHIGFMAQEVEQTHPEAVHDIGGIKFVDYKKATMPITGWAGELMEAA